MSSHIRLRSGERLPRTIAEYDEGRTGIGRRRLRAVCYAPYVSMDFDPIGSIRLCNHSHSVVAQLTPDTSVLDVWRGEVYGLYRAEMASYILDEHNCQHCIRQCVAGSGRHVFAIEHFDSAATDDVAPAFPKRLIFRLNSTCNLGCVMCDGLTSSRIRRERDRLPLAPSAYGERFFKDMEVMLPHAEHLEFYGGEPFLVKEHVRIFEILSKVKARCTIYVNTNNVSLHPKAKQFLETLNFKTVAVSMDAVSAELHQEIRLGLRSDLFSANIDYLLDLRSRKGLEVMLNVTEHRKNWFELPQIFRFAEVRRMYLHINTCIHPHNVTLYTLPTNQLQYVLMYLEQQRTVLLAEYPYLSNLPRYDFLLSLIRSELSSRGPDWQPPHSELNVASDGRLAAPRPDAAPFETPQKMDAEADRIVRTLDASTAACLIGEIVSRLRARDAAAWIPLRTKLERVLDTLSPAKFSR